MSIKYSALRVVLGPLGPNDIEPIQQCCQKLQSLSMRHRELRLLLEQDKLSEALEILLSEYSIIIPISSKELCHPRAPNHITKTLSESMCKFGLIMKTLNCVRRMSVCTYSRDILETCVESWGCDIHLDSMTIQSYKSTDHVLINLLYDVCQKVSFHIEPGCVQLVNNSD